MLSGRIIFEFKKEKDGLMPIIVYRDELKAESSINTHTIRNRDIPVLRDQLDYALKQAEKKINNDE